MPARSHRPTAKDAPDASAPSWVRELAEPDAPRKGPTTQVSLFPASELEPGPPRPHRRLARLKSLLAVFDARKDARLVVKPDERHDSIGRRTDLWLDSFFDH